MSDVLRATNTSADVALYQSLRHLFTAAQTSSIADKYWTLHSCFTDERHVMTEYEAKDGSRVRADSTGERGPDGRFPEHEFAFYAAPKAADAGEG